MENKLDLAANQIYGFVIREKGGTMRELINGMALTRSEWEKIKKSDDYFYISGKTVAEIDEILTPPTHERKET